MTNPLFLPIGRAVSGALQVTVLDQIAAQSDIIRVDVLEDFIYLHLAVPDSLFKLFGNRAQNYHLLFFLWREGL